MWAPTSGLTAAMLRAPACTYAHCPSVVGAGASSGSQPYPEAADGGVRTKIGIDTHSNDYVENLKLAVICGRARAAAERATRTTLVRPSA